MTNKSEAIERQLVVLSTKSYLSLHLSYHMDLQDGWFGQSLSVQFCFETAFQSKTNFSVLFVFTFSFW